MNPRKDLSTCPKCHAKTKFLLIGEKKAKGEAPLVLGMFKCSKCGWKSEPQGFDHYPAISTRPKNPLYLIRHYDKQNKLLYIWVYTTERAIDPSSPHYKDIDRHLLTVEATPHSLRIYPSVPFSLQSKRLEEGLMFLVDNKELAASLCSQCSQEQRKECLKSKEPCRKIDMT